MSLLEADALEVRYGSGRSALTRGRRRLARGRAGRVARDRRRVGVRQVDARARDRADRPDRGRAACALDGRDVTNARGSALRHVRDRVQIVFQDPFASLNPRMTIGATLEEAVAPAPPPRATARRAGRRGGASCSSS